MWSAASLHMGIKLCQVLMGPLSSGPRRRLLRDPSVPDAHYKSCMERMLGSAQKLSGLLHGQSVRGCGCFAEKIGTSQLVREGCEQQSSKCVPTAAWPIGEGCGFARSATAVPLAQGTAWRPADSHSPQERLALPL